MFKRYKKNLSVLLVLLFVAQVTAAPVVSCMMELPSELIASEHSGHHMISEENSYDMEEVNSMEHNCCSGIDSCSMASCFMLAITSSLDIQSSSPIYQTIASRHFSLIHPSISSLYRPPILS